MNGLQTDFDPHRGTPTAPKAKNEKAKNIDLYYWTNENQAEIDFIARIGKDIIPIEVKASDNIRSKSLTVFMKKYNPPYAIRISAKNFGLHFNLKNSFIFLTASPQRKQIFT